MNQVVTRKMAAPSIAAAPAVSYESVSGNPLDAPGALAVFGFGSRAELADDPRCFRVGLDPLSRPLVQEVWRVDATVTQGKRGPLQWAAGGGWLFAALDLDAGGKEGIEGTARHAYATLCGFLADHAACHVQRLWNYLGHINAGEADEERYKRFCDGRAAGMGDFFASGFPAATAIGHHLQDDRLQVYCLAATQPGRRVENPRQMSAWTYPRQYGATPPSFARATALAGGDALAISGTASIVGHASQHEGDLHAQLHETLANLHALLDAGGMPPRFGAHTPLKVYVRHAGHAPQVRQLLQERLPGTPILLLHGDVCRRELLVEIDGWSYR